MPTKEQVWLAADEVHRTGERVNQDRVIAVLKRRWRGGSQREVGSHRLEWKAARAYDPRLEKASLPPALKDQHVGFMAQLWEAASVEAALRLEDGRKRVKAEGRAARELMDDAYVEAEVATRENALLRTRVAEMEAEVASLRMRVSDLLAAEFWDRVMREIEAVLPRDAWVPDRDVLRLLPPSLAQEAIRYGEPLTRGMLNKKMGVWVTHERYFELEENDDGVKRYRRAKF